MKKTKTSVWNHIDIFLKASALFLLISLFAGIGVKETSANFGDRIQHCGSRLANKLQVICNGRFNRVPGKRSGRYGIIRLHDILHPRQRRGIVEECCERQCSIQVLESYCAPGVGSTRPPLSTKYIVKSMVTGKSTSKGRGRQGAGTVRPVQYDEDRDFDLLENPIARMKEQGYFFVVNQTNRGE